MALVDLHCHLLPGVDDGSGSLVESLEMARGFCRDGVGVVACTPHFFPGVYNNSGPDIRSRVARLQDDLDAEGIPLRLVVGGDVHIAPDLVAKLKSGEALSLNDSRYVLVEPPHHILPPNMDGLFFDLLSAGYVPILTHPERMSWLEREYALVERLALSGVLMQITAGSILGSFGNRARDRSSRMLRDGMVHLVASDAHDMARRPPVMGEALAVLKEWVGEAEAMNLMSVRPKIILRDLSPGAAPAPLRRQSVRGGNASRGGDRVSVWSRIAGYFRAG